jgi:hypothetical protein
MRIKRGTGSILFADSLARADRGRGSPVKLKKYHDFSFQCDDAVWAEAAL